jgi:hypothetical protein
MLIKKLLNEFYYWFQQPKIEVLFTDEEVCEADIQTIQSRPLNDADYAWRCDLKFLDNDNLVDFKRIVRLKSEKIERAFEEQLINPSDSFRVSVLFFQERLKIWLLGINKRSLGVSYGVHEGNNGESRHYNSAWIIHHKDEIITEYNFETGRNGYKKRPYAFHRPRVSLYYISLIDEIENLLRFIDVVVSETSPLVSNRDQRLDAYIRFSLVNPISQENALTKLFNNLKDDCYLIEKKSKAVAFKHIFNGKPIKEKTSWIGSLASLKYLIVQMMDTGIIHSFTFGRNHSIASSFLHEGEVFDSEKIEDASYKKEGEEVKILHALEIFDIETDWISEIV